MQTYVGLESVAENLKSQCHPQTFVLNSSSKRIQKENHGSRIGHQFGNEDDHSYTGHGSSHDKIQDKGDYILIHRLNNTTKRMNQILQCKRCPLKFPKLCNLRDHLRIHNDEMPY